MLARGYEADVQAVRRWPWPVFCALWARLLDDERRRLVRDARRRERAENEQTRGELLADLDAGE